MRMHMSLLWRELCTFQILSLLLISFLHRTIVVQIIICIDNSLKWSHNARLHEELDENGKVYLGLFNLQLQSLYNSQWKQHLFLVLLIEKALHTIFSCVVFGKCIAYFLTTTQPLSFGMFIIFMCLVVLSFFFLWFLCYFRCVIFYQTVTMVPVVNDF